MSVQAGFKPGVTCEFSWWTSYKAPSASDAETVEWVELYPGDVGKIVSVYPEGDAHGYVATVKFNRLNRLVKLRKTMLKLTSHQHTEAK